MGLYEDLERSVNESDLDRIQIYLNPEDELYTTHLSGILHFASTSNNTDVVKFIEPHISQSHDNLDYIKNAITNGNLEMTKIILENSDIAPHRLTQLLVSSIKFPKIFDYIKTKDYSKEDITSAAGMEISRLLRKDDFQTIIELIKIGASAPVYEIEKKGRYDILDIIKKTNYHNVINKFMLQSALKEKNIKFVDYIVQSSSDKFSMTSVDLDIDVFNWGILDHIEGLKEITISTYKERINIPQLKVEKFSLIGENLKELLSIPVATSIKLHVNHDCYLEKELFSNHTDFINDLSIEGGSNLPYIFNLTKLEKLRITNSSIKELPEIENLTKLKYMYIKYTLIKNIPKTNFKNLSNLLTINLSNNSIEFFDTDIFNYVPKLLFFDISYNNLKHGIQKPHYREYEEFLTGNQKMVLTSDEFLKLSDKFILTILRGHTINNSSIILKDAASDELVLKKMANIYKKFPKAIVQRYGNDIVGTFEHHINKGCDNLTTDPDPIVYIEEIDGKKYTFCFTQKEYNQVKNEGYNPFTGRPVPGEFIGIAEEIIKADKPGINCGISNPKMSKDAKELLSFWKREVFTLGNIYFKIPIHIRKEWAVTRPCTSKTLYRGMSFRKKEQYIAFLNQCKNMDDYSMCNFRTNTFTSWTFSKDMAKYFAGAEYGGKYAIILECEINPENMVVAIPNSVEEEVVVVPGLYKSKMEIQDFIPAKDNHSEWGDAFL